MADFSISPNSPTELTATDSTTNQLSSSSSRRSNAGAEQTEEICLSLSQTIFMALMASFATVGVVVMLICQIGCIGRDQQANGKTLLAPVNYPARQQRYHEEASNRRLRPYQNDPEVMG